MAIVAGIDEAGLGPLMGPLVVSAVAFEMPDELAEVSMWDLLSAAVARKPGRRHSRIAVGDSKKMYSRQKKNALEHLERAVLAVLATRGRKPRSLKSLLNCVSPAAAEHVDGYPWYAWADLPLPHCISETDVALAGNSLEAAMQDAGVSLLAARSETMFVRQFNRVVEATDNKSTLLFDITSRLMAYLWSKSAGKPLKIHVDRQGGRMRYLPALQRVFQEWNCKFKILDETETFSAYRITAADREAEVFFSVDGEQRQLPVAMASMLSKYVRELCMALLNGFWAQHVANLTPTAGYYADGRRFRTDIQAAVKNLNIDEGMLYRNR